MDKLLDYMPRLQRFMRDSRFAERGAVMTDLDGTAVHEFEGRVILSKSVELGLERVHATGREVLINTMRFPRSIMQAFGAEWRRASGSDMLVVSLKGSLVGRIAATESGELAFEEIESFTLTAEELAEVLIGVRGLCEQGVEELLVFFYPRDWRQGELIWTPDAQRIAQVQAKFRSASRVFSGDIESLAAALHAQPQCLLLLLIDAPQDRLMAYQHTERARFVTHRGVDKRHGALSLAASLGVSLADSVGAGDSEIDNFLDEVGLAAIVGNQDVGFKGRYETVRLPDAPAFGEMLLAIADAAPRTQGVASR
jgi:hydroxymethylpyrimidine pyrophosphatase-like HAD family hydrolase